MDTIALVILQKELSFMDLRNLRRQVTELNLSPS